MDKMNIIKSETDKNNNIEQGEPAFSSPETGLTWDTKKEQ